MRVLLSTIGSRGEVQPLLALALELRRLSVDVRTCVPPDFREWIEKAGIPVVPLGPALRGTATAGSSLRRSLSSPEGRRALAEASLAAQFATIGEAARACDVVVGCGALQIAAPSVAELYGAPYVHVHYCPKTLPSGHHAPPRLPGWELDESAPAELQWESDARRWNETWRQALNAHRAAAGLDPVDDVRSSVFTERPWLACDRLLGPWPGSSDEVVQTGAWLLPDDSPLPPEVEAFLDAGEPPVYFGLGSMGVPNEEVARAMVGAARVVGCRCVLSRGWADLRLPDDGPDCISVGEINHRALFPRVRAAVHHGGAGTTTVAARAGAPQVVLPQRYDQPYWAHRVEALGIGVAHESHTPTSATLSTALDKAMEPEVVSRANSVAGAVHTDGARVAAERLTATTLT